MRACPLRDLGAGTFDLAADPHELLHLLGPVAHLLGAALLEAGKPAEAERFVRSS